MTKHLLHTDIETRSAIDITDCGSYKYIDSNTFDILLIAYAIDDGPVQVIDLTKGDVDLAPFRKALYDPDYVKIAWNAAFERTAYKRFFGEYCDPHQWEDAMVLAAYCGLPLSLGQCGEALCLPADKAKDKRGKDLIKLFCNYNEKKERFVEPKEKPAEWEEFISYNRQDVETERVIYNMLKQFAPPEAEHEIWCLDQKINEKGILIDDTFCMQAEIMGGKYKAELMEEAVAITGLANPNSTAQVKQWLQLQEGIEIPSLNKKEIVDVMGMLKEDDTKRFLELRSKLAKTSLKKYDAMMAKATSHYIKDGKSITDNHAKGCFQFYGTHTGRWAGRGIQLQNLPQNHLPDLDSARVLVRNGDYDTVHVLYDDVNDTLSQLIRTAIIPEPEHCFCVADFSAIEARVTAWLAGEDWRLDVFRNGGDIYCASASQMFKVPVEKHGVNGHLRQKGKVAELALGYGGGVGALLAFDADKLGMSNEEMGETVAKWRGASPKITELWKTLERAAIRCCQSHTTVETGVKGTAYEWEHGVMWLRLPSGRRMAYFNPEYSDLVRKFGSGKCLNYMVLDQTSKKWRRVDTWGGKLTENLVQAVARDCLRDCMLALDKEGWDIRGHVHDEVICTEPLNSGRTWQDMAEIMSRPLPWAEGLPLRADGYSCPYYMKD